MKKGKKKGKKISIFGSFGSGNFGNESTLQAILYNLHRYFPDAQVTCICTGPERASAFHKIEAVPISRIIVRPWTTRNPLAKWVRKVFINIPCELYRWLEAFRTLQNADMLIVAGTGLVTDAYGLRNWGPYGMFKWSLTAKLCRCKLLFISVGAGPIYSALGRWLIKSALSLAVFRSYRDNTSMEYLKGIGFQTNNDGVYPDLAFSLPRADMLSDDIPKRSGNIVGIGLMGYAGRYSTDRPSNTTYPSYLENLAVFAKWLLAHGYNIRLLIGDIGDRSATQEFKELLKEHASPCYEGRIIDEPILSVDDLMSQLAATDVVVATRFHNVLLALVLNKPVISISFHHKCVSLMDEMGLSEYCQDIHNLEAGRLIEQFCALRKDAENIRFMIGQKVEECRIALDEQYSFVFQE